MAGLGLIVILLVAGGIFFSSGLEARRKPAYPYRGLDVGFQLAVGGIALLLGGIGALAFLLRGIWALF